MMADEMVGTAAEARAQKLRVPAPTLQKWFEFGHRLNGYHIAEELSLDLSELAEAQRHAHRTEGSWPGSLLELRLVLFYEARAVRFVDGLADAPDHQTMIASLLDAIARAEDERLRDEGERSVAGTPEVLHLGIGGYGGPSYAVDWRDGRLVYSAVEFGSYQNGNDVELNSKRYIRPSRQQWQRFWSAFDKLGVWNWEQHYYSDVQDGTSWGIDVQMAGRSANSGGSNAYPGSASPKMSGEFRRYLRAVRNLLGGKLSFA